MKTAYEERVDWYNNNIVSNVSKCLHIVNDKDRETAIKDVLTNAVVELEQTVDDIYKAKNISNDTKAKIADFSKDIAKSKEINRREGAGEGLRKFKKFFSWSESPSDFFDTLLQSVQARGGKILKETTKTSTRSVVPKSDQAAADKVAQEKAAAEKATKAAADEAVKLKDQPSKRSKTSAEGRSKAPSTAVRTTNVVPDIVPAPRAPSKTVVTSEEQSEVQKAEIAERMRRVAAGAGNQEAKRSMLQTKLNAQDQAKLEAIKPSVVPHVSRAHIKVRD